MPVVNVNDAIGILKRRVNTFLSSQGTSLLIYGPEGIGKTHLLQELKEVIPVSCFTLFSNSPRALSRSIQYLLDENPNLKKKLGSYVQFDKPQDIKSLKEILYAFIRISPVIFIMEDVDMLKPIERKRLEELLNEFDDKKILFIFSSKQKNILPCKEIFELRPYGMGDIINLLESKGIKSDFSFVYWLFLASNGIIGKIEKIMRKLSYRSKRNLKGSTLNFLTDSLNTLPSKIRKKLCLMSHLPYIDSGIAKELLPLEELIEKGILFEREGKYFFNPMMDFSFCDSFRVNEGDEIRSICEILCNEKSINAIHLLSASSRISVPKKSDTMDCLTYIFLKSVHEGLEFSAFEAGKLLCRYFTPRSLEIFLKNHPETLHYVPLKALKRMEVEGKLPSLGLPFLYIKEGKYQKAWDVLMDGTVFNQADPLSKGLLYRKRAEVAYSFGRIKEALGETRNAKRYFHPQKNYFHRKRAEFFEETLLCWLGKKKFDRAKVYTFLSENIGHPMDLFNVFIYYLDMFLLTGYFEDFLNIVSFFNFPVTESDRIINTLLKAECLIEKGEVPVEEVEGLLKSIKVNEQSIWYPVKLRLTATMLLNNGRFREALKFLDEASRIYREGGFNIGYEKSMILKNEILYLLKGKKVPMTSLGKKVSELKILDLFKYEAKIRMFCFTGKLKEVKKLWIRYIENCVRFSAEKRAYYFAKRIERIGIKLKPPERKKIKIEFFGTFNITLLDGTIETKIGSLKSLYLLALLASSEITKRYLTPRKIAQIIWPDMPPERQIHNVHWLMNSIRNNLGEVFQRNKNFISLDPNKIEVDIVEFNNLYREGKKLIKFGNMESAIEKLIRAIDLYRGEPFENIVWDPLDMLIWTLRDMLLDACYILSSFFLKTFRMSMAIKYAQIGLQADPFSEDFHKVRIIGELLKGNFGSARQYFDRFSETLQKELSLSPSFSWYEVVKEFNLLISNKKSNIHEV